MGLSLDRILEIVGVVGVIIGVGVSIAMAPKAKSEMLFAIGCFVFSGLALCLTVGVWAFSTDVSPVIRRVSTGILCAVICVSMVEATKWTERRYRAEQKPIASLDQRNRLQMLKRVRMDWIEGVLKQSLYRVARIELGLQNYSAAVSEPSRAIVQSLDRPPAVVPLGTPMSQVFDDQAGALLILGAPGTGKTTLLLELARDLLDRAKQDVNHPMPVVFNLSSWAVLRLPLDRWLVSELNERSDVPKPVALRWVETEQIIPLLDGLDEVAVDHRQACTDAINDFRRNYGFLPIAVCSRIADYNALATKLRLRSAVVVQPLTRSEVRDYVERTGEPLRELRMALRRDSALWELLETPLMLWVAMLAYRDAPVKFFAAETLRLRRKRLFAAFVDAMFKRRSADTRYNPTQTISWLRWLASALKRNEQTVFYLENLRVEWLPTRLQEWLARAGLVTGSGLVGGALGGLAGGLLGMLTFAYSVSPQIRLIMGTGYGLVIGLVVGLTVGLFGAFWEISPVETVRITGVGMLSRTKRAERVGLAAGSGAALMFWLIFRLFFGAGGHLQLALGTKIILDFSDFGIRAALQTGAVFALAFAALTLLSGQEVETHTRPNQGTQRSLKMAVATALVVGLIAGLDSRLVHPGGMIPNSVGAALISGLTVGGLFVFRHFVLRVMLWMNRSAPFRYVRFLDYSVERLFLRKVGGGYIFIHRMLMEYFASLPE